MDSIGKLLQELKGFKDALSKSMNQSPTTISPNISDAASSSAQPDSSAPSTNVSLEKDSRDPKFAPKERKIKELQQRIDTGTYKPDASKIAEKVIPHIMPVGGSGGGRIIPNSPKDLSKEEELTFNKCGQWSIKKADETKHDRCAEGVKEKSPEVKNPHAVCVAAGVEPDKWKK